MNPSTLQNAMNRLGDFDPLRGLATLSTPDRPIPDPVQNEAFVGRIFEALIGALELFAIYLGHRLEFYDALRVPRRSQAGPRVAGAAGSGGDPHGRRCPVARAPTGRTAGARSLVGPGFLPVAPLGCEAALRGIPSQDEDHSRPNTRPRTAKAGYVVARAPLDHECFLFHARSGPSETIAHAAQARHWTY